ncbi:hypothetical protein MY04_1224 [Flammeovirga sp. MY04]|uniref:hypothetical protein n=1 Tax=Flammeovirga sp. MY04 TaxID=1191459 RepID=UPI0013053AA3|nr:hypothetical protein [Flammeovirga sp. MY04]ANQ48601.2 hypothetical protein MY04_1224 [Flammeovirga sp. MY04]
MQRQLICIILILIPSLVLGQNATVIKRNVGKSVQTKVLKFDMHLSVIFSKDYQTNFNREYLAQRFTPDSLTIDLVESKLEEQFVKAYKRYLEAEWKTFEQNKESYDWKHLVKNKGQREKSLIEAARKEQKKLDEIHRQYLGLINNKGEKIILIQLVDLRNDEYELKNSLEKEWIVGFGDWFEENTSSFEYVIDRDKLYFFGWTER